MQIRQQVHEASTVEKLYRAAHDDYHSERFDRGQENQFYFVLADPWQAWTEARKAAHTFAGMQDLEATVPWVADLGPWCGWVVGCRSPDGLRGWRIDIDNPDPRRCPATPTHHVRFAAVPKLHVNWEDRTLAPDGRNRSGRLYGANYVVIQMADDELVEKATAAQRQMYWEILSHFPGRVVAP